MQCRIPHETKNENLVPQNSIDPTTNQNRGTGMLLLCGLAGLAGLALIAGCSKTDVNKVDTTKRPSEEPGSEMTSTNL